jgi:alkaline phosphatase D
MIRSQGYREFYRKNGLPDWRLPQSPQEDCMARLSLVTDARRPMLFMAILIVLSLALAACLPAPQATVKQGAVQTLAQQTDTPAITHGPISGEISATGAVLWARGSGAGDLQFDVAESADFAAVVMTATVAIDAATDFTGKTPIDGLAADTTYYYRVALVTGDVTSQRAAGQFTTAPATTTAAPLNFVFGACLGGQNYCRDKATGWVIFDQMAAAQPDFFMITGDSIYVDTACDGDKNVPGAEGPFHDLEGYRTRYRYHLEDTHYAEFLATTPVYTTWDDHELINDFGGPQIKSLNADLLKAGTQAYFEYWPLTGNAEEPNRIYRQIRYGAHADFFILDTRSYRDPNVNWDPHPRTLKPKTMLGAEQFAWLQQGLADSDATWKFIVTSVPLAYPTGFPQPEVDGRDGWANYTERSGYESELLALTFYLATHNIRNVVFLAGDTHWPYAISYDPDRDGEANFYELASSPLSAIPLAPPATLDPTLNPTVLYAEGEFMGDLFNFGQVAIDEAGALTYRVVDWQGKERYALQLQPE